MTSIKLPPAALRLLCQAAGVTLDSAMPCVLSQGKLWEVDASHPAFPRPRRRSHGPGTELKALLKTIGIVASPTCSCNKRARVMDQRGCDWCEENIEEIDRWLAEEAKKRKLPYLSLAGKALIRLAIRRARKKGNSR